MELDDDAELLECDDGLPTVLSSDTPRAWHSLTWTSTTTTDSTRACSALTVSGDSCVMRHAGIVATRPSKALTSDSRAQSAVKCGSWRGRVVVVRRRAASSPLVTVEDVDVTTFMSTGADLGRADELANLARRICSRV